MSEFPAGVVTFLFADVEESSKLWKSSPAKMEKTVERLHAILRDTILCHQGYIHKMRDGCEAAFPTPADAVLAAVRMQECVRAEPWPFFSLNLRTALHVGQRIELSEEHPGPAWMRAAKLLSLGHGGQILLSSTVASLVRKSLPGGAELRNLGRYRIPELPAPEEIFQLVNPGLPEEFPPLRTPTGTLHNLPNHPGRFVGREKEMLEILNLLETGRLVTLTGAGGCGKTRLAIHAALKSAGHYPHGVWMVDLSMLRSQRLVPQRVAETLNLRDEPHQPLIKTITHHLQHQQTLLLLDNCEHLLEACGDLIRVLLSSCLSLQILATSRQPLHVPREQVWRVPSLSLPRAGKENSLDEILQSDAVALFVERGKIFSDALALSETNLRIIGEICRRLDGIPLAIELAAARTASLSLQAIQDRLQDRFRLLSSGTANSLTRHQTLRAAIDWSYNALARNEKILLRRLSVFSGGFTQEALEQICPDVSSSISNLADKSLLMADETAQESPRHRLLETIREYARVKLEEAGEYADTRGRHLNYFVKFAEEANRQMVGADQKIWLDRLEAEHDNLREVLDWCSRSQERADSELRLVAALWWFWQVRGHVREGREAIASALAHSPAAELQSLRGLALYGGSSLALEQSDYLEAQIMAEQSLAIFRHTADLKQTAVCHNRLGEVSLLQGDYATALKHYQESLSIFHKLSDWWNVAVLTLNIGIVAERNRDYQKAEQLYQRAIPLFEAAGDTRGIALALNNLGELAQLAGDYPLACKRYEEALATFNKLGDSRRAAAVLIGLGLAWLAQKEPGKAASCFSQSVQIAVEMKDNLVISWALDGFAYLSIISGQVDRSAMLLGIAQALRNKIGYSLSEIELRIRNQYLDLLGQELQSERYQKLVADGESLGVDQAVRMALAPESSPGQPVHGNLTR